MINFFNATLVSSPFIAWFLVSGDHFSLSGEEEKATAYEVLQSQLFCGWFGVKETIESLRNQERTILIACGIEFALFLHFGSSVSKEYSFSSFVLIFGGGVGDLIIYLDLLNSVPVQGLVVFWDSKQNFHAVGWSIALLPFPIFFPFCGHQLHYTLLILFWYFNIIICSFLSKI